MYWHEPVIEMTSCFLQPVQGYHFPTPWSVNDMCEVPLQCEVKGSDSERKEYSGVWAVRTEWFWGVSSKVCWPFMLQNHCADQILQGFHWWIPAHKMLHDHPDFVCPSLHSPPQWIHHHYRTDAVDAIEFSPLADCLTTSAKHSAQDAAL